MNRIARLLVVAALLMVAVPALAVGPPTPNGPPAVSDPWAKLQFLVGKWAGEGSGKPGEGSGGSSFTFDLNQKILVRRNWADYPPKDGDGPTVHHEDLMVITPKQGGDGFFAIYFDNEGHTIHYEVSFPAAAAGAIFESANDGKGPRFKLSYGLDTAGVLTVDFAIAPPGQPYKTYVTGKLKKSP